MASLFACPGASRWGRREKFTSSHACIVFPRHRRRAEPATASNENHEAAQYLPDRRARQSARNPCEKRKRARNVEMTARGYDREMLMPARIDPLQKWLEHLRSSMRYWDITVLFVVTFLFPPSTFDDREALCPHGLLSYTCNWHGS